MKTKYYRLFADKDTLLLAVNGDKVENLAMTQDGSHLIINKPFEMLYLEEKNCEEVLGREWNYQNLWDYAAKKGFAAFVRKFCT